LRNLRANRPLSWPAPPRASTVSTCNALISPANRDRAAASAAAPSDSKITMAGVLAASWAVNAIPAGVALSRASSQNSPTLGGSSGSSGVTGTYAGPAPGAPSGLRSETPPRLGHDGSAHDGSGGRFGGSVLDITLHLTASVTETDHSIVRGTESLFGPSRAPRQSTSSARMAMTAARSVNDCVLSVSKGRPGVFSRALGRHNNGHRG